jgi:hypothetical protein
VDEVDAAEPELDAAFVTLPETEGVAVVDSAKTRAMRPNDTAKTPHQ